MICPDFKKVRLKGDNKMSKFRSSIVALAIFVFFGIAYGFITNIFFDNVITALWTPLAIALYFLTFGVLICILTIIIVRKFNKSIDSKLIIRDIAIIIVALFLASMLFELLYEIGIDAKIKDPDSYILMIDDSGSMSDSDPNNQRADAIGKFH